MNENKQLKHTIPIQIKNCNEMLNKRFAWVTPNIRKKKEKEENENRKKKISKFFGKNLQIK